MKEPVILSHEEMTSPDKDKIINSRLSFHQESAALSYLTDLDENKKAELYELSAGDDTRHLDSRQKEAIESHFRHDIIDTYVDRTFTEKIMDLDSSPKLRRTEHTTETKERVER